MSTSSWLASALSKTFCACSRAVFKRESDSSVFPALSRALICSTNSFKASLLATFGVACSATAGVVTAGSATAASVVVTAGVVATSGLISATAAGAS